MCASVCGGYVCVCVFSFKKWDTLLPKSYYSSLIKYIQVTCSSTNDLETRKSERNGNLMWLQPHFFDNFIIFFPVIFISWRLITLQYCSGFYHTLTWMFYFFSLIILIVSLFLFFSRFPGATLRGKKYRPLFDYFLKVSLETSITGTLHNLCVW